MNARFISIFAVLGLLSGSCGSVNDGGRSSEIQASSTTAVVSTQSGDVAGYVQDGINIFKGIPYAQAERFMAPTDPQPWDGVRSSRQFGPTCPQTVRNGWRSDEIAFAFNWDDGFPGEDCLRANIWTPALNDGAKRPVMLWLHGGGYSAGSGQELPSYDGANLARKGDVVVVTINHRLNVLGFLDLSAYGDEYAFSGNAGLLDLVAALRWVNRNIEAFGGDPQNVTIFGQSGGGGKVSTLLATPAADGFFHKAIVQSGSMLRTMESRQSRLIAAATLDILGLKAEDVGKLKTIPHAQLLEAGEKAIARVRAEVEKESGVVSFIFGWAPVVDGNVLPSQPFDPIAPEQSRDIPMMIGTTRHEFCPSTYVPALRTISMEDAEKSVREKYGDKADEFLAAFAKAYPGYKAADLIDTDFTFRPGAVEQAEVKLAQGGAPVYMYMFAWESPVMDGALRSTHCMEIPFVFDNAALHASMTGGGEQAIELAGKISTAWLNFAKTGKPSAKGLPEWVEYDSQKRSTMYFDNKCRIVEGHDKELLDVIVQFPVRGK